MASVQTSLRVPPPKNYTIYVLGISGLPPQLYSHFGWQATKDLVRVILQYHDQIDRNSNAKPGMVHMSVSSIKDSVTNQKKQLLTAHIHLKSWEAAWHAWSTINGNSLWGHPLTAQIFPDPSGDAKNQIPVGKLWTPAKWRKPHDLADRFTITFPGEKYFWVLNPDGKLEKVETDNTKSKKRGGKGLTSKHPGPLARTSSDISSCPTLVNTPPSPYQSPTREGLADGTYALPPSTGFVTDFHGCLRRFHQTSMGQTYETTRYIQWEMHTPTQEMPVEGTYPTLEDVQRH